MAFTVEMGLLQSHAILIQFLLVVTITTVTSLPLLQNSGNRPNYDLRHPQGGQPGIDIGFEIHNMHVRKKLGVGNTLGQNNVDESNTDRVVDPKKLSILNSDGSEDEHTEKESGMENQLADTASPVYAPEQDLQQTDDSALVLELEELVPPTWKSASINETSGLLGSEDQLALLANPTSDSEMALTSPKKEMGSIAEDLPSEPQPHDQNVVSQLRNLSDSKSGRSSAVEYGSGEGYLDYGSIFENVDDIEASGSGTGGNYLSVADNFPHEILSSLGFSGSGSLSGHVEVSDGSANQDMTYTTPPQSEMMASFKRTAAPSSSLNELEDTYRVRDQNPKMGDLVSVHIAEGKGNERVHGGVSVRDRLKLELEGLSLVDTGTAPEVNEGEENDADEGSGASQGTLEVFHSAYSTETPPPTTLRPVDSSPPLGDVHMLTPVPARRPVGQALPDADCPPNQLACRSGPQCVPTEYFCDLVTDCADGSDETAAICVSSRQCGAEYFRCGSSAQCVNQVYKCDGIYQCYNGEDEKDCITCVDLHGSKHILTADDFCDGVADCSDASDEDSQRCKLPCSPGYTKCGDSLQCVREDLVCNGVYNCRDESDETDCGRTMTECEVFGMFACDGLCHPVTALCDYTYDCMNGMDEDGCSYE